ncbi:hypothetical protein AB0I10_00345 [Streptomyces sp. NPDC050636]
MSSNYDYSDADPGITAEDADAADEDENTEEDPGDYDPDPERP